MTDSLNAGGICKNCRKNSYCKKACTQAKRRQKDLINQAISNTPMSKLANQVLAMSQYAKY